MKGNIDMNAVTGEVDAPKSSDAEISGLLEQESDILMTVVKQPEDTTYTGAGGAFFKYLILTNFDLSKYGLFRNIDRNNYKHK